MMHPRNLLCFLLLLPLLAASAVSSEINACKYLEVTDFTDDPYGIAEELREQASKKGFTVVTAIADLSPADLLKTCVMSGSWWRTLNGGRLSMRMARYTISNSARSLHGTS
jgi:hypothetical protein